MWPLATEVSIQHFGHETHMAIFAANIIIVYSSFILLYVFSVFMDVSLQKRWFWLSLVSTYVLLHLSWEKQCHCYSELQWYQNHIFHQSSWMRDGWHWLIWLGNEGLNLKRVFLRIWVSFIFRQARNLNDFKIQGLFQPLQFDYRNYQKMDKIFPIFWEFSENLS